MNEMHIIPSYVKKQRGCQYCADVGHIRAGNHGMRFACPHDECPYHVLDKHETYEKFMASEDSRILVDGFFQTAASCYDLANGNAVVVDVFKNTYSNNNF